MLCSVCCMAQIVCSFLVFFFKQKTAYEMRISDWSSDVCSSDPPEPVLDDEHDPEQDRREQDGDLDGRHPLRATEPPAHSSAAWLLGGGDVVGIALRSGIDDAEHDDRGADEQRSEENTSELQSLMRISYAVFCLTEQTTDYKTKT